MMDGGMHQGDFDTAETLRGFLDQMDIRRVLACLRHACVIQASLLRRTGNPDGARALISASKALEDAASRLNGL
jgi:hypothetical protein